MIKRYTGIIDCVRIGLALLAIISSLGCATGNVLGTPFEKISTVPSHAGIVYMYRASKSDEVALLHRRFEEWRYVMANGEVVASLFEGGYYPYVAPPGRTEFKMYDHSISVEVEAGHIYFVRAKAKIGFFSVQSLLELVPVEIAEKEIKDCRIMKIMMLPRMP